jgi:predicted permease
MRLDPNIDRSKRAWRWLDDLRRDVLYALRTLRRNPGFAAVAVVTLALGIGATTAVFSVVHALLLKPLPYKDSERLVRASIVSTSPAGQPQRSGRITAAEVNDLRANSRTITSPSFTVGPVFMTLIGRGEAARLQGLRVAPGLFTMLGVPALAGRTLGEADETGGPAPSAVIVSYAAWQRYFGGDPSIVGQTIAMANSLAPNSQFNIEGFTVVGVMPKAFVFPDANAQFWLPSSWNPSTAGSMMARLADGATLPAAAAELTGMLRQLRGNPALSVELLRARDSVVAPVKPALVVLAFAVAFVLLIACVNVANLLLARAAAREREIGIRLAIGAGRGRVVRQLLTESTLLAVLSGAAGSLIAIGGTRLMRQLASTFARFDLGVQLSFPRLDEIAVDGSVLAFAILVSLATGLLCGLAPALGLSRPDRLGRLKEYSLAQAGSPAGGRRLRGVLTAAEIALALVLLVGAGLLLRSFAKLTSVDTGYDRQHVLTFQISLPDLPPGAELRTLADEVVAGLRRVPGIESAAFARQVPLVAIRESAWFRHSPELSTPPPRQPPDAPDARLVSQDYFAVLGVRMIAGRGFTDADVAGAPRAMVINQTLARKEFPGVNPIGRFVYAGRDATPWQIVGIAADVRQFGLDQEPQAQFFADFRQWPSGDPTLFTVLGPYFAVRTNRDAPALMPHIRDIVRRLNDQAGVYNVGTMEQLLANSVSRPRMYATLLGIFAGVAIVLAAVGIYGVIAYAVAQRTREIGVRMALGAQRHEVLALVLRQNVVWILAGLMLGVAGAIATTRYLSTLLYGLTPLDVSTFAMAVALFATVAVIASCIPARRATQVDPAIALRSE